MSKINLIEALLTPCRTKGHLAAWIRKFIGVDFPSGVVCDDEIHAEPSNSSPLDFIWEVYSKGMSFDGVDWNFEKVLAFANRDGGKTLAFSILEILAIFHMGRDVAHAAAIEQQAQKCASYVEGFLNKEPFRDFIYGNNKRKIEICWYESLDKKVVYTWKTFENLLKRGEVKESDFTRRFHYIIILVATIKSLNSSHCSFVALDELDLVDPKPYAEALSIPCPTPDGRPPIIVMTSTRKFAFGLVQKEIDEAEATGLHIRHWNVIDVTKACPPERHLPKEPKVNLFYNTNTLATIQEDDYDLLGTDAQRHWYRAEGYSGCKTCPIFAACRGRLATKQKSKSKFLKDIPEVINVFRRRAKDPDFAKAQLLCWAPGSVGLIYPLLNPAIHYKTPSQMAEMITGDPHPEDFTKSQLIELFKSLGAKFLGGIDWGWTHAFAVVVAALWGQTLYVIEVISVSEMELGQRIDLCKKVVLPMNPLIYADPESPGDVKSFARAGFRMAGFKKDVLEGISAVRAKVMPTLGSTPELYFLANDPNVELLFNQLRQYHWMIDSAGRPTDSPDDTDDDLSDAMRYLVQPFVSKLYRKPNHPKPMQGANPESLILQAQETNKRIMEDHLKLLTGRQATGERTIIRKGRKFFAG